MKVKVKIIIIKKLDSNNDTESDNFEEDKDIDSNEKLFLF